MRTSSQCTWPEVLAPAGMKEIELRVVASMRSAGFTNLLSGSICERLINITSIREMKSAVEGRVVAAARKE